MSRVHIFQRYSQRENVVTNNTLLLLSRLYTYSPFRFNDFLREALEVPSIEVGVSFKQQTKAQKGSVPDGLLAQQSFKIVVETKLHSIYDADQLARHLSAFGDEEIRVLLLLSPVEPDPNFKAEVWDSIKDFSQKRNKQIALVCTTFERLIESYEGSLAEHDYEMKELIEDYRNFCSETNLLPRDKYMMRAVNCGLTLDENFEFNLYYDPAIRAYRQHKYIGIYHDKCVWGIGEIENIIAADLVDSGLHVIESASPVTDDQRERIIKVIAKAKENNGWDISQDQRFFLVRQFHQTEYRKESPGPMRGIQYFDLKEVLGDSDLPGSDLLSVSQIAEMLKQKRWEDKL